MIVTRSAKLAGLLFFAVLGAATGVLALRPADGHEEPEADVPPAATVATDRATGAALADSPSLLPPNDVRRLLVLPRMNDPAIVGQPAGYPMAARSDAVEMAARDADLQTRNGFELAGRKAWFSARAEFILALRTVAQALDNEEGSPNHSRALAAGLAALAEADDFVPPPSRLDADWDLASIIAVHRTPVLYQADLRSLTPVAAMQSYLTFAQEQLAFAGGDEVAASMALYALGRLHTALAKEPLNIARTARPKAVALHQTALLVNPRNYMASNELGVLLAEAGRNEDARRALEHSVSISPQSAGWHNLAQVYARLGRADLAGQAQNQCAAMVQAETARLGRNPVAPGPGVEWLDPAAFAQASPTTGPLAVPPPAAAQPVQPVQPAPQTPPARSAFRWPSFSRTDRLPRRAGHDPIVLCQALGPAAPCAICGVDCSSCSWCGRCGWERMRAIAWQAYAQGEYVGHYRTVHVPEYRLRADDQLDMIYRVTREETSHPYRLNVGDEIRVESLTDSVLNRELIIQPDGTITLRLLGQVRATGLTVTQLRDELEKRYAQFYKVPTITVTPLKVNTKLEDLRATVDRRMGQGGQSQLVRVTPEGTVSLPAIGTVPAQGLTLNELQRELNERYREQVEGIEVIPVLAQRAPRYVYVLGEVRVPGRYELTGPTTAMQALSMAGGWQMGANLHKIVVFRRGDDWRLMATMLDLHKALYGNQPCAPGEIWISDSDVVLVPKNLAQTADEIIEMVFTRGLYGVFPVNFAVNFSKLSTI